jgi:hypothetical protein
MYQDEFGWIYKIRGNSVGKFTVWYKNPNGNWLKSWLFPWRDDKETAQADLDNVAALRGWKKK